jgi:hypothetical protein
MKTIVIDGLDVEIDNLSDGMLITQLRFAEASVVSVALGGEPDTWADAAQKTLAEGKLRALQNAARKRKLQVE